MKKYFFILFLCSQTISAQVVLEADGSGNTYELINSVLANPGKDVVEVPDCKHTNFGRHIDEVFDTELNKQVFRFHIHVNEDDDRCINTDRQRNEIKTYASSPENLKANIGETVEYKWKFKLSNTFKTSANFTHIHQIKSVGGEYESIPMITLTLRKSNPDRLELRYTPTNNQNTLKTAALDLFKGNWVEVYEKITYGNNGSYQIEIKNSLTQEIIFNYTDSNLDLWQGNAEFARPKWGIYRSLINSTDLQDEIVLFADFSIEEISNPLFLEDIKNNADKIILAPNPSSEIITFKNVTNDTFNTIELYNNSGQKISTKNRLKENTLNVNGLSKGLYFIVLKKENLKSKVLKCIVN